MKFYFEINLFFYIYLRVKHIKKNLKSFYGLFFYFIAKICLVESVKIIIKKKGFQEIFIKKNITIN